MQHSVKRHADRRPSSSSSVFIETLDLKGIRHMTANNVEHQTTINVQKTAIERLMKSVTNDSDKR